MTHGQSYEAAFGLYFDPRVLDVFFMALLFNLRQAEQDEGCCPHDLTQVWCLFVWEER